MRIPIIVACNLTAQGSNSSVGGSAIWNGGKGYLRINSFIISLGSPVITISAALDGIDILTEIGLPSTISATGWYLFEAPIGTEIALNFQVSPGEAASLGESFLYTFQ